MSSFEDRHWRAILGQEGNAAIYGLTALASAAGGAFALHLWWNQLASPDVMCGLDSNCVVRTDVLVEYAIGVMVWMAVSTGLAAFAWLERPQYVNIHLSRFHLDLGARRIALSDVLEAGRYRKSLVLAMRDSELAIIPLGDGRLVAEIATAIRQRLPFIESQTDVETARELTRLRQLTPLIPESRRA